MTALEAPVADSAPLHAAADRARRAAVDRLLALQSGEGWWKGELETNVTMDAEDLLLRHFLGILDGEVARRTARWIRSNQREDGTWATFYGGPPDLSATVEAYVALRLAGADPAEPSMRRAAEWCRSQGGIGASRVFTRIWLALVGRWSWEDLPVVPPEIMFLPPSVPLNIYDFACWARQTIVPLTVLMALRPARELPFGLFELGEGQAPVGGRPDLRTTGGRFEALDRLLHRYERLPGAFLPRRLLRDAALRRAEEWIVRRQEADGLWGGIQPPVVYSVMALHALGYPVDHPVVRSALDGIESFTIDDAKGRRLEACQSPVWDTALAVVALCDAGVDPAEPPVSRAVRWLLGEEVAVAGDWAVRRPGLAPGGWAFEFHNDNYPDIDDTAEVVLALRAAAPGDPAVEAACRRAVAWVEGMQSRSGGWGAFDADNTSRLAASLPFCDFGEVTDPPSADVTAHVIEMLAGEPGADPAVLERGLRWLSGEQEADGSWFGRWGVNHVYGTGAAVPALVAAGVPTSDPRIRRAVSWLESCQNDDGGWGEDLRSYVDPAWRGRGASTPSQTAWALLALLAAGAHASGAVERGIQWLAANQLPDGGWDEPWFTGTGFPWDFTINYHLYRLVWPLMALGRYVNAGGRRPPE
ncbi:MAG TPA: squalene--hopene cyclase [Acidimicrobiales bacterium]|nr:squalene--hopene cyclase [Acidimicrobiales bacterium]